MTNEIAQRIETLINNTRNDKIIWKRISPTNFEWKSIVARDYQNDEERLISNTEIGYSIQRSEGNYIMVGHQIRYCFAVIDLQNKETLINIESHNDQNEETILILKKLFDEVTEQHNRKVLLFLDKTIV
jgi:hypothetical protein